MIFQGIDAGASTTKIVLIDENENIIAYSIVPTKADFKLAYEEAKNILIKKTKINFDNIIYTISTGYGRDLVRAESQISEITALARGAVAYDDSIRTIIDVGGQDSKAIRLNNEGRVIDFAMNDKCAAGTGRFLEVMANILGLTVDKLGEIHFSSKKPISISSTCTVFAESEIISHISSGARVPDIIAGIHNAIATKIYNMAYRINIKPELLATGGVAKNRGFIYSLSKLVGYDIKVPREPQIICAFGAALIALSKYLGK